MEKGVSLIWGEALFKAKKALPCEFPLDTPLLKGDWEEFQRALFTWLNPKVYSPIYRW